MNATRNPRLTRRRIITGAVVLVLVLAVVGLFGMFDRDPEGALNVTFVRFQASADGTNILATLTLSNRSQRTLRFFSFDNFATVLSEVWRRVPSEELMLPSQVPSIADYAKPVGSRLMPMIGDYTPPGSILLGPGTNLTQNIRLPHEGQRVRLAVLYSVEDTRKPGVGLFVAQLWARMFGHGRSIQGAICNQEIQCPLRRPDGTVEPPRLVPKDSKTP